jgi:hypothetical protein
MADFTWPKKGSGGGGGGGDVVGPGSSTNNAISVWDGTTGDTLKNSSVLINGNQLLAPDGTAAAPSYSFLNSLGMGQYRIGDNDLGFATSGVVRARLSPSGALSIGPFTPWTDMAVYVHRKPLGTNATEYGILQDYEIQNGGSITDFYGERTFISTAAGTAITNLTHYAASGATFTGTVDNQYGFFAESSLTGATSNIGFYGNLATGWNFYANGAAPNYMNGSLWLGKFYSTAKLDVAGSARALALELEDPGAGTDLITIQAPTLSAGYTLTLPVDDGNSGQVLSTNGSGVLSWVAGGTLPTLGAELSILKVRGAAAVWDLDFNDMTKTRSGKDSNGIFTTVEWRDATPALRKSSVLTGTSPTYATRTVNYYDTDGVTVLKTVVYSVSYDIDGDFLEEEI